jgi:predicted RNA-binding Zn-ribbon protein involved in translation (DUF1610 family)
VIPVTLGTLVFLCLGGMLAGIFGAWILSESRRQRRERHAFRGVLRCTMCGCEFEDANGGEIAPCPRCGTLNERRRLSRL